MMNRIKEIERRLRELEEQKKALELERKLREKQKELKKLELEVRHPFLKKLTELMAKTVKEKPAYVPVKREPSMSLLDKI